MDTWSHLLAAGEPGEEEARLRRFDGEYRWFLFRAVPIRDEQGAVVRWYGTNTDIEDRKLAEERVRQAESELRLLIDTIPAMAWSALPDGSIDFLSQGCLDYYGLSLEAAKASGWNRLVHPEDLPGVVEAWRAAVTSGAPYEHVARSLQASGEYRWCMSRAVQLRNTCGNIVKWYGTTSDIEDLKRAESLLSTEKLTLELIAGGANLKEILENLCNCLDAQCPKLISSILLMDPDSKRLRPGAGARVPKEWTEAVISETVVPCRNSCGAAEFLKQRVIVSDIATDPSWVDFRAVALRNGLRAVWSQPIVSKGNEVLGAFCIYSPERRTPQLTDIQLLERAAHVALIAIERERSQAALINALDELRKSEAQLRRDEVELRRIVDLIPQAICVTEPDGTPLYANRVLLDYMGISPDEMRSVGLGGRLSHPEDVEKYRTIRKESLARGVPFHLEFRIPDKHGVHRWFLFLYNPLSDEHGQIVRWYATATDIDERKKTEEKIENENLALREEIDHSSMFEEIVGSSEPLRKILAQVSRVAPTDSTVLILGETGTGKELIARAIHKRSNRATRAFVRVNCAAIPPQLIASELFGHEKGAFTGAVQRRLGRFELANGGTIFLDEIGDLPMETQLVLLHVLQEREFERVGSSKPVSVDVRVLAATHRDLKAAVAAGTFREDLFYRLNVFPIQMPSLRERVDDIPLLVEYLIERYAKKAGKKIWNIEKKTLKLFQAYRWPGNIRELQNVVERAVILSDGGTFSVDETWLTYESPRESHTLTMPAGGLRRLDDQHEKEMIEAALAESGGRVSGRSGAASKLGIPRQTLESKINNLGINKHRFKSA